MKRIHYISKEISILESTGIAACGIYVSREKYGDDVTRNRQDVTCKNCKRTRIYKQTKDQQTCKRCGKIVGCDYTGRKHKCDCAGAFIAVPDDRK